MRNAPTITTALALLAWSPAASADAASPEASRLTPAISAKLTDMDVLAERHLALYRVSRASVLGLQEPTEDGTPASVRTSATVAIPLAEQGISDGPDVPVPR